jgi:hypothetical protein
MAYSNKVIDHYENPRNVGSFAKDDPKFRECNIVMVFHTDRTPPPDFNRICPHVHTESEETKESGIAQVASDAREINLTIVAAAMVAVLLAFGY